MSIAWAEADQLLEADMIKWLVVLVLGVMATGVVGCHAEGHADKSGVGGTVEPSK